MTAETWPKEEQRLRNGACGQVPVNVPSDDEEAFDKKCRQAVIDTEVDAIWVESIARDHAGMGAPDRWNASERAAALLSMVKLHTARSTQAAIREGLAKIEAAILDAGTENAGAIDSMGTVLGAVYAESHSVVCKGRTCRRGT